LSGGQLYDKIKAKYKFKPKEVKTIMYGILKGLREMHSDLKPENLLFRK
jgi:serine/threonine protein kinase